VRDGGDRARLPRFDDVLHREHAARPEIVRDLDLFRHGLKMVPCDPSLLVPFPDGSAAPLVVGSMVTVCFENKPVTSDGQTPGVGVSGLESDGGDLFFWRRK
jgi:hypothetical protein